MTVTELRVESDESKLHSLFKEYWEFVLESWPHIATFLGDHRYDDRLPDLSAGAYDRWTRKATELLDRLQGVRREGLSQSDLVSIELFTGELRQRIEAARFRPYLLPVDQLGGPHIDFPQLTSIHPFRMVADFENYVKRLRAFPLLVDQAITCMEEGLRLRMTVPRVAGEKVVAQLRLQVVDMPEKSDLYKPIEKFPDTFSDEEKNRLRGMVRDAVRDSVVPAYRKLLEFVEEKYLPGCRAEAGVWALPDGLEYYSFQVRSYTTAKLSPEEIHETGKRELTRIHGEMREIMRKVGFTGDFHAFFEYLRNTPRFYFDSAESILAYCRDVMSRIELQVHRLFGRLPKSQCEVKEIEAFRAEAAPLAHYYPAPDDGSRPAYFYVNTFKPETRARYEMEAVIYHEGVPGHHFQIALQQELRNLPDFRRHGGYVWPGYGSYFEGWALYCEVLPKELGGYEDPYSDFGRLSSEAFRAARLVIDTGLHYFKWTREQAVEFFKANTPTPDQDIGAEVDRYMVAPGQALSYKIGQLKILELRKRAEAKMGDQFNLSRFHDELLGDGALPLDAMEKKMENWMSRMSAA